MNGAEENRMAPPKYKRTFFAVTANPEVLSLVSMGVRDEQAREVGTRSLRSVQ